MPVAIRTNNKVVNKKSFPSDHFDWRSCNLFVLLLPTNGCIGRYNSNFARLFDSLYSLSIIHSTLIAIHNHTFPIYALGHFFNCRTNNNLFKRTLLISKHYFSTSVKTGNSLWVNTFLCAFCKTPLSYRHTLFFSEMFGEARQSIVCTVVFSCKWHLYCFRKVMLWIESTSLIADY